MVWCDAGFVTILGSPNVGKSTLMNALVGERVSIVSPKQQTTRHQIMGVVGGRQARRQHAGEADGEGVVWCGCNR